MAPLDLGPPAQEMTRIANGIRDDQLDRPTPCEIPVRTLLTHALGLAVAFRDAARKVKGPTTSTAPNAAEMALPEDWRTQLPHLMDELAEAWRQPDAWQGMTMAGGVEMPAEVCAMVGSNELVIHGWDLAMATGQDFHVAESNLQASYQFCSQTPDDPRVREGLFGPVIKIPEDAPLLDRTLGFAGRDPGWKPGATG